MVADHDHGRPENPAHQAPSVSASEPLFKEERPGGGIRVTMPEHRAGPVSEVHEVIPAGGSGLGTILTSAVLAFLLGGAGAWTYQNYLAPRLSPQQSEARQTVEREPGPSQANLLSRVDDLSGKLDQLKSRVEALPKPSPAPDMEPLKEKVAAVDELSKRVQSVEARLNELPKQIDQEGKQITTLTAKLEEVSHRMEGLGKEAGARARNEGDKREAMKPVSETIDQLAKSAENTAEGTFGAGAGLFKQKKYKEANEFFGTLDKADQNDARVWYYAALSRGFATGDWKGETERLANRGVERERAGTPPKAAIDSTFNDLTPATGKDWLAFFRRRAAQPAAGAPQ